MPIPLSYNLRNPWWVRRLTTVLTAEGMALVVFVFAAVLMLAQGLKETLGSTGSPDNALAVRRAAQAEMQSIIPLDQAPWWRPSPKSPSIRRARAWPCTRDSGAHQLD